MLSIFQDDRSTTLSNRMVLFRDLSRSTRTCPSEPTTNYQLQKSIFLKGQRNISEQNTSSSNVYRMFLGRKIDLSGVFPNNIKAGQTQLLEAKLCLVSSRCQCQRTTEKLIALKKTYLLFTLTSTVQSSSDFIPIMVWSASTSLYILHFPHIYREPVEHLCFRKFRTFFH